MHHIHLRSAHTHKATPQQDQAHKSLFYGSRRHRAAKISIEGNTSIDPTNRRIRDPPPPDQHFNSHALIDYPGKHVS